MEARAVAGVRVWHAAPGVREVSVYVDGQELFADLAYGGMTDYAEVSPGRHSVEVAGEGVAIDEELELRPSQVDMLAVAGVRPHVHAFRVHDNTPAFARELSKVRLIHAVADAPALDVAIGGGPALFQGVGRETATPFELVEPGTYDLQVRAATSGERLLTLPDVTLAGGTIYSLLALGLRWSEPALGLIPFLEAVQVCTPG